MNKIHLQIGSLFFLLLSMCSVFAQDNDTPDVSALPPRKSKFLTGVYVGSYFANKHTASTYNGYGFDVDGNRNSFLNSFMYQKIVNEYGGRATQQYDYIADALGVDQNQWTFAESDMPVNMRYIPGIMLGLNLKLPVDRKSALVLNINASRLNLEGNFTITTLRPPTANPFNNNNINTFAIRGSEQRLLIQLGFQRVFGEPDKLNFFGELGFVGTLAKFDKNMIYINNLEIDLTYYLNQTLYAAPGPTRRPLGFGVGAFAALGLNFDINPKFIVQILYSPSQERVNIGVNPTLKMQHGVGFRAYYKI